jgi:MAE_28990/MAE_18760-like HEPN
MSKPYSEDEFSAQITEDRSWRLKEISDLKNAIDRADEQLQQVLLRALITICYAHWEGYIRFAARKYLEHIALRKFQYAVLDRQFFRNYFLPRLSALSTSKTSIAERCALIDDVLSFSDRRFSHVNEDLINTKANLSSDVFADICLVCGIPSEILLENRTFIDVVLLKRRNEIAHGEDTFVVVEDLDEITNKIVALMRQFGDLLENRIYLKEYRLAVA